MLMLMLVVVVVTDNAGGGGVLPNHTPSTFGERIKCVCVYVCCFTLFFSDSHTKKFTILE